MSCNEGTKGMERCGFRLGKAYNAPCDLMKRTFGINGPDTVMYVRFAKLVPPEKFLSRLNACGERVNDKRFCGSATKAYVWEAYAFKEYAKVENFDSAASPIVNMTAFGGDGIHTLENKDNTPLYRCTLYKDKGITAEARFTGYDIFIKNQWSNGVHSWGNNGTILPASNSSYTYTSLLDDEGIGIICPFNELWVSKYWYMRGTGRNVATHYWEVQFRPREIMKNDLLMYLIKRNCCRPCEEPETVQELRCPENCKDDCGLVDTLTVKDDDKITTPKGEITGEDYKKKKEDLEGDDGGKPSGDCLDVCVRNTNSIRVLVMNSTPVPALIKNKGADQCIPICGTGGQVKTDWLPVVEIVNNLFDSFKIRVKEFKNTKGLDLNAVDKMETKILSNWNNIYSYFNICKETPESTPEFYKQCRFKAASIMYLYCQQGSEPNFFQDPLQKDLLSEDAKYLDHTRQLSTPDYAFNIAFAHIFFQLYDARYKEVCGTNKSVTDKNDVFFLDPWEKIWGNVDNTFDFITRMYFSGAPLLGEKEFQNFCTTIMGKLSWFAQCYNVNPKKVQLAKNVNFKLPNEVCKFLSEFQMSENERPSTPIPSPDYNRMDNSDINPENGVDEASTGNAPQNAADSAHCSATEPVVEEDSEASQQDMEFESSQSPN